MLGLRYLLLKYTEKTPLWEEALIEFYWAFLKTKNNMKVLFVLYLELCYFDIVTCNWKHQRTVEKSSFKHRLVVLLLPLSLDLAGELFESGKIRAEICTGLCYGG